jgi:hypothetical protein
MEMEVKNILDKNMIPELYGWDTRCIYLLENRGYMYNTRVSADQESIDPVRTTIIRGQLFI